MANAVEEYHIVESKKFTLYRKDEHGHDRYICDTDARWTVNKIKELLETEE